MSDWSLWVDAIIGIATVSIAVAAWRTSIEAFRTAYRPVLRPVPIVAPGSGPNGATFKIKNVGSGPALSVALIDASESGNVLGEVGIIEPLQTATTDGTNQNRIGDVQLWLRHPALLDDEREYRLLYQDIRGTWPESRFTIRGRRFVVRFLGPQKRWRRGQAVPTAVSERCSVE